MRISTEINSAAAHVGQAQAIRLIAEAGFDAWDFSMFDMAPFDWSNQRVASTDHPLAGADYLAYARKLKQIGLDHGIHCNQSHAPFPVFCPEIRSMLKRAIECTAEAGGNICIIHPDNNKSPEENGEMYLELLPFAKAHGVKIATENMWNWDTAKDEALPAACSDPASFNAHLDAVNDDFLVACLDIGHAEMRGLRTNAVEMIHALGHRLQALHLHDNNRWKDSHQIPFSMDIDFPAVAEALGRIGYSGYFTLEADAYLGDFTRDTVLKGLQEMAAAARRLVDLFEADSRS